MLAALGVSALIAASPPAFTALKITGGVYLIWLGSKAIRNARAFGTPQVGKGPAETRGRLFVKGLVANAILAKFSRGTPAKLDADALAAMERYPFPGNVRELRNLLERACLLADGETILPGHLPDLSRRAAQQQAPTAFREQVLAHTGSRRELAERLGISERTLYRRLRSHDLAR